MYARRIPPLNGKRGRASRLVFRNYFVEGRPLLGSPGVLLVPCVRFCDRIRPRACAFSLPPSLQLALSPQPPQGRVGFRVSDEKRKKFLQEIPILIESALNVNVFIRNWPTNEPTTEQLDNCFRNSDATRAQCLTNATNEFIPNWSNDSVLVREHLIFIRCSNWNQSSKKYKFVVSNIPPDEKKKDF